MLKRFLKDSGIYGVTSVLSRGMGLLLIPLYTRVLTPAEYGVVDLMQVVRYFAALVVALEIGQGLVRLFLEAGSDEERRTLASSALWFTAGGYALFCAAALPFAEPLSRWVTGVEGGAGAFRLGVVYIAVAGVATLMQDLLRFDFRPRAYAAATLGNLGVAAAVTVALLLGTPLRVEAVFLGLIAGSVAGAALALRASRARYASAFQWARCREMLAFSIPLVASSAAVYVSMFVDRVAIRQLMTLSDVGIYGVAARFSAATALVVTGVQMSLTPLVYSRHADPSTPDEIARIFRLVAAVLLPAVVVLGVFGPEVVGFVTTPAYVPAAGVIPLLATSVVLSQFWVFAPGLGIAKRTRWIAGLNVAGALLNTALNYLLIPSLGVYGAGVATLAGALLTAVGYVVLGSRHYRVPHAWARLAAAAAVGGAALALSGALWGHRAASGAGEWGGKAAVALAATAAAWALLVRRGEAARALALARRRPAGGAAPPSPALAERGEG